MLVVTYSETDRVKYNDASVYRHTIFLWLKTRTLQNNEPYKKIKRVSVRN